MDGFGVEIELANGTSRGNAEDAFHAEGAISPD